MDSLMLLPTIFEDYKLVSWIFFSLLVFVVISNNCWLCNFCF